MMIAVYIAAPRINKGNEVADKQAGLTFVWPEPTCGISIERLRKLERKVRKHDVGHRWHTTPWIKQSKKLITWSTEKAKQALRLNKNELKLITKMFTGHGPVSYHLHDIGRAQSVLCRYCAVKVDDTALRSSGVRDSNTSVRFGKCWLQNDDIGSVPLGALIKKEYLAPSAIRMDWPEQCRTEKQ